MTEAIKEILVTLLERAETSTIILVLISILVGLVCFVLMSLYTLSRTYFIIEIQKKTTAKAMNKVNDVLYGIEKCSKRFVEKNVSGVLKYDVCDGCYHPIESFDGVIHNALFLGTSPRLKERWHENGFLKLKKDRALFDHEVDTFCSRLRNKSQSQMENATRELREFISETHDRRFSVSAGREAVVEIFEEWILLKEQERVDIKRVLMFKKELV